MSDSKYRPRVHVRRQRWDWCDRDLLIAARVPAFDARDPEHTAPVRVVRAPVTAYVDGRLVRR